MRSRLADATWPSVDGAALVLVPVGATEQHGPHLPLDTDTVIARAVADGVAARLRDEPLLAPPGLRPGSVTVAPAITFGASGEHQAFAGTSSIGTPVLTSVLIELGRSMSEWARRIVFINGHGGNLDALSHAVLQLRDEGRDVDWCGCAASGGDSHAGFTETSLMLHLEPERVRMELAAAGDTRPLAMLLPLLRDGGVASVSTNGVLGDPAGANADHGRTLLATMVEAALRAAVGDQRVRR